MKDRQLTLNAKMKTCQGCGEKTHPDLIAKWPGRAKNPPVLCKSCKAQGKYSTSQSSRTHNRKYKYGIGDDEYDAMMKAQDYRCAICRAKTRNSTWGTLALFIDHDHETGKVRGLLCNKCNTAMSIVENPEHLVRAVEYMRAHYGNNYKVPPIRISGEPLRRVRKRE